MIKEKCLNCKTIFETQPSFKSKFCSKKCFDSQPKVWLIGNTFRKGISSWNKGKPLTEETKIKLRAVLKGRKAWNKGMKRWWSSPTQWKKGDNLKEKHPNWNGGISRAYKTGYYSVGYKDWRKSVFERDKYICQDCGIKKCYITAHHIKSFAKYPELRLVISNGRTLCKDCHKKTDNYGGRNKRELLID